MKKIVAYFMAFVASNTVANQPTISSQIVTPDVATTVYLFDEHSFRYGEQLLVCASRRTKDECNTPIDKLSTTKTYAGFKLSYGSSGRVYLEVYYR